MRKIFYLFALLNLPFISSAFNHNYGNLTGYWYNARFDDAIRLKEKSNILIVKGLLKHKKSIVFDQIGRNSFEDDCGNVLKIEDYNTIVYIKRKGREYFRFERINSDRNHRHSNSCERGCNKHKKHGHDDDDFFRDENDYDNYRRNDWRGDNGNGNDWSRDHNDNYNEYSRGDYESIDLEGTWKADNVKEYVAIITTRDGIRAKFSGSQKWVDFVQDKNKNNEFTDSKGNKYLWNGEGLIWLPSNSSKNKIFLRKVKDEVAY